MSEKDRKVDQGGGTPRRRSIPVLLVRYVVGLSLLPVALFVPAGRLDWWKGWAFVIFFLASVGAISAWGMLKRPDLMKERSRIGPNVEWWDKCIMAVYTLLLFAVLVVAGLDAGRSDRSSVPLELGILGWLGLVVCMILVWWTLSENAYASKMVRIQHDRGHKVVTTGPYRFVRHPMYVGVIVCAPGIPLVLGSVWALIPGAMIVPLFIIRTALEDRTLREKLPGYKQYMEKVRYRLLPAVW